MALWQPPAIDVWTPRNGMWAAYGANLGHQSLSARTGAIRGFLDREFIELDLAAARHFRELLIGEFVALLGLGSVSLGSLVLGSLLLVLALLALLFRSHDNLPSSKGF